MCVRVLIHMPVNSHQLERPLGALQMGARKDLSFDSDALWKTNPYFSVDNARVIYTKRSKFVKNEHARYTLERYERYEKR